MSDDDWKRDAAFVLLMMFGSFISGACLGHNASISAFQQEAVDKGHAEYDSKTTEFKWMQIAEKPE